jgi:muramoyltetrapeptide carboxypeptidase
MGYRVDFGPNAFNKLNYLAGTDEERLGDLNEALRDPNVRAIFATRGGKGSYRIADRLDFAAARRDPKFLVGFSDITALHLALLRNGAGGSIHGAPRGDGRDTTGSGHGPSLTTLLTETGEVSIAALASEPTAVLSNGRSATGRLIGGNLDMVTTCAGWALPPLAGAILLLEAVNMFMGQVDRQLTLLRKGGHLDGVAGIAFGQFTDINPSGTWSIVDLLRQHFEPLGVPILGGLPLGHGANSESFPLGYVARLDGAAQTLTTRMAP